MIAAPAVPTSALSDAILSGLRLLGTLPANADDVTFYSGQVGHVLAYAYAYKLTGDDDHWKRMMGALDNVLGKLQDPRTASLLTQPGLLPKLGYVLQLLQRDDIVEIDLGEETLAQFDDLIFKHALTYLRARNTDFLYGAAGAMHYLGTRAAARPQVAGYLHQLLDALLQTKIEDERGVRFYNAHINRANGSDELNIGLAHGHCGLLLVLLQLHETGLLQPELTTLVDRMLTYLLGLEITPEPAKGRLSHFPLRHHDDLPLHDARNRQCYGTRMGWCYGDLNVVQVLYRAHQVLGRPELLAIAHRVGEYSCTRRTEAESGVDSPHLCHGSSSLALCYRRLHQLQPLPCYREAQAYWVQRTLAQLPATYAQVDTAFQSSGLLMGLPGLLLVLLTEELDAPLAWPELFLL
ncbi:hypothetical protein GCM10027422_23860 [Hymenobacter arcticus]